MTTKDKAQYLVFSVFLEILFDFFFFNSIYGLAKIGFCQTIHSEAISEFNLEDV